GSVHGRAQRGYFFSLESSSTSVDLDLGVAYDSVPLSRFCLDVKGKVFGRADQGAKTEHRQTVLDVRKRQQLRDLAAEKANNFRRCSDRDQHARPISDFMVRDAGLLQGRYVRQG